ncbi:hypothetical protein [Vibrio splendidus]|uniref:hypothetical protein n=1 Tax=Vibrio splendidus TaxID=29497 RepID=UPI0021185D88|nr:hypothetical protein [Vibrio splendidus]MCQ8869755.1 hypothetical protein [Vibrio splendidus]
MASKNPIKGFIRCHMPDCGAIATVHAVGEHRILTEGNPPKNKRNTGRLYYNCPCCGFQQGKGATFQAHIESQMKPTKSELKPQEAASEKVVISHPVTEVKPEVKPIVTASEMSLKPDTTRLQAAKPYIYGLLALVGLFFLLNKKDTPANG